MPDGEPNQSNGVWGVAVTLLGAAAGITGFVALVGGAMLWIRFDELGLPADRAVASLPKSLLLTVGAHSILGPLVIGLVALLFLILIDPIDADGRPKTRFWGPLGKFDGSPARRRANG